MAIFIGREGPCCESDETTHTSGELTKTRIWLLGAARALCQRPNR